VNRSKDALAALVSDLRHGTTERYRGEGADAVADALASLAARVAALEAALERIERWATLEDDDKPLRCLAHIKAQAVAALAKVQP
jgi:hypothetical protein